MTNKIDFDMFFLSNIFSAKKSLKTVPGQLSASSHHQDDCGRKYFKEDGQCSKNAFFDSNRISTSIQMMTNIRFNIKNKRFTQCLN
jgi:hypothetical protein